MQEALLNSSTCLAEQVVVHKTGNKFTSAELVLFNKIFTLFLGCIELFKDLKTDFITKSVRKTCSILQKKVKVTMQNKFGMPVIKSRFYSSQWNKSSAQAEIKVTV